MKFQVSLAEAMQQLETEKKNRFIAVMKHGSMVAEYYAPLKTDPQTPHEQDELYIVVRGSGFFYRDGKQTHCKAGDLLFVPAAMEHRFEDFTEDFAVWVIFYGPPGGERAP